jgi:chorismate synthase
VEGGISNGSEIVVRGHLKPISTLRRPLGSVDFASRELVKAAYERSDVCAVPAAGVVGEAMVALTLAAAALEKFGGDSLVELRRNYEGYCEQLRNY